ncbi:hypothetical protein AVEN_156374-1 [Araneus ventricosus]|uniref:Uncharacterized protein n=1 Tax=Araneus ventricosus TaxID=182803 RepID=A0A4Y2HVL1_ARAVE|nr:hypothetical protein AVEN_208392-1 [Araneus ventricosus]GBM69486.1 hypothetical protein AVEN_250471-1 [Araneus ventricosus]GBM69508.1 hypothetical protein AVEN_130634-1 [Araneus ventricosus]GBM69518.1 hypothetical protein AVEN_156374-1 [Araneus ventricosus]
MAGYDLLKSQRVNVSLTAANNAVVLNTLRKKCPSHEPNKAFTIFSVRKRKYDQSCCVTGRNNTHPQNTMIGHVKNVIISGRQQCGNELA